jgi:hypothetical protein
MLQKKRGMGGIKWVTTFHCVTGTGLVFYFFYKICILGNGEQGLQEDLQTTATATLQLQLTATATKNNPTCTTCVPSSTYIHSKR